MVIGHSALLATFTSCSFSCQATVVYCSGVPKVLDKKHACMWVSSYTAIYQLSSLSNDCDILKITSLMLI